MTAADIYGQLAISLPGLRPLVSTFKAMNGRRSILVTLKDEKKMIFTYIKPGVWNICSIDYWNNKSKKGDTV